MTPPGPGTWTNPAYSVGVRIPPQAAGILQALLTDAPGTITCHEDDTDAAGCRCLVFDTDGPRTLSWLRTELRTRLGQRLLYLDDPVFTTAATGKLTQRVCAPAATSHDQALLDADADRRVTTHLAAHPRDADRYTGRSRRVALLCDGSAVLDFEPLPAGAALPALESQAVHLRRAIGLDIFPLPVATTTPEDLAAVLRMLAPGFSAACLAYTQTDHIDTVRAALGDTLGIPLLDTINHGLAVAATAATVRALRRAGIKPERARVVLIDPGRGGDLAGLLLATGIGDLTLYEPFRSGTGPLHDLVPYTDLVIDCIGLASPLKNVPVLRARPEIPPPLGAATTAPRPLHALPGLLAAAVRTHRPITVDAQLAAAQTLAGLAPHGHLLPPLDHPGLVPAITAAATHALG